ncbi:MAG TPA: RNA 2',3'-cyclic phosphodiesterase [Nitrospiria bacterium]|nr:RNA 2',3'-cyclic phosphodiesterase [Nitrospiria bacterium]
MRLFIAFELPPEIIKAVAAVQSKLKKTEAHVTWVRPEGIHLTLKFLGEVPEPRIPEIEGALEAAAKGTGPISVTIGGVGAFPDGTRPRVIWVGVQSHQQGSPGDDRAEGDKLPGVNTFGELAGRIEKELGRLGFEENNRPFRPHLTLGRVRSSRGRKALIESLKTALQDPLGTCRFEKIELMRSELKPGGAVYSRIQTISLN